MWYVAALVGIVVIGLFALQAVRIVQGYRKATGTPWQKLLAAFSDSLVILWARALALSSSAAAWFTTFAPALDPQSSVGGAITAVLKPQYVPYYGLAVAVLFEIFRRRSGSIDPIQPPAQDKH